MMKRWPKHVNEVKTCEEDLLNREFSALPCSDS
jgi:hypothetical protein